MRPDATRLRSDDRGVTLSIAGLDRFFSWSWLRDHARDDGSYHADSEQRLVPLATSTTIGPGTTIEPGTPVIADHRLRVTWPDGSTTHLPLQLLGDVDAPSQMYDTFAESQQPWTGVELASRVATVDAEGFVNDDELLAFVLDRLRRDGVVIVEDVDVDVTATRRVLERFGYVRMSIFGDVWTFGSDGVLDDTASTSLDIEPHTDGTYSADAPGMLALHCLRRATGGASVVVDGLTVARRLATEDATSAEMLRTTEIPGRYVGDGAHLVAWRPVLRHEHGRLAQVSYNHHDRAPFVLPEPEMTDVYRALRRFHDLTARTELRYEFTLEPGQMLLIDNWRVLHGRQAFAGERRMAGGYVNREDIESRVRTLAGAAT
ncbi:MAG: TauD/TfdA family dioxygenase [Acidimicrobiia bacterium]|nr:TauD/TfdA family dioxygenase [Acidimicrobiia bacterium]